MRRTPQGRLRCLRVWPRRSGRRNPGNRKQGRCHGETKLAQHESHGPTSGTKLALLAQNGPFLKCFARAGHTFYRFRQQKTTQGEFPFAPSPHQEHPHRAGQFFLQPVHDRRVHTSNHHRRWESAQRPTPTGTLQRRNTTQPRAPSTQINQDLHSEMITPTYMASSFSH